jgi:hypothetical protein
MAAIIQQKVYWEEPAKQSYVDLLDALLLSVVNNWVTLPAADAGRRQVVWPAGTIHTCSICSYHLIDLIDYTLSSIE